jgi:hypothetical protein
MTSIGYVDHSKIAINGTVVENRVISTIDMVIV